MKKRATSRIYISYGSNMDLDQMAYRCPGAEVLGKSVLEGWRLAFMGRAGNAHATILPEQGASTPVVVWAITPEHEAALDRYEGVSGGYYRRHFLPVKVEGKTHRDALVYLMNPQPYNLPTPRYLLGIQEGYRAADIHPDPLYTALHDAAERQGQWRDGKEVG